MNACHEPISWLRLEHYHIGELPPGEHSQVQTHLDSCPHCRAMLAEIEDDARTLPPLPLPSTAQPWYRRLSVLIPSIATPVLVAALALVMVLPPTDSDQLPGSRVAYKGGELAVRLVRERAGAIAQDSTTYVDGDRFEVLISTPPGQHAWDLVVLQEGQAFFPLEGGEVQGGNTVSLGFFALAGPGDAAVCAMVDEGRVDRAELQARGAEALADGAACVTLKQSTGGHP